MDADDKIPSESVQNEVVRLKEYYSNMLEENRQSHDSRESQFQEELARLRSEISKLKRQQSNLTAVSTLEAELVRQEQYYTNLLEQSTARLQTKEKAFQAELELLR